MKPASSVAERARKLRARMVADDIWEMVEWRTLYDELRAAPATEDTRAAWEEAAAAFPAAAQIWARYAESEIAAGNAAAVRDIFKRSLLDVRSIELLMVYVRFIKKVNEPRGPEGVEEVRQAYDFAIDQVGQDIASGPLWLDYLSFLSGAKPSTPAYTALWTTGMVGGQEDATRTAALRRVYQRAVVVPTHSLEVLWKQYENFEMGQANKQLAPRTIADQRPRFQAARMAYRERKRKLEGIDAAAWAVPPGKGGPAQEQQARLWRGYLDSERSNTQRLDRESLVARVALAFDQALCVLRHFPELWCEYARWHAESGGGPERATDVLARGAEALPNCLLLHFALADAHEAAGQTEAAQQVYEALVSQLEAAPAEGAAAPADGAAAADGAAGQQQQQQKEEQQEPQPRGGPVAALPEDQRALAWIQYMRYQRRHDVAQSRRLFIRARRSPRCPWQVYAAAAGLEWRLSREKEVARRIFEKGLDAGSGCLTEPQYIIAYSAFLCEVGDTANARALFERALTEEPNRRSAALCERYLSLEFDLGDLAGALRLEKRAREVPGFERGGLFSGVLPWVVEDFLNRLPPPQLLDGPMPDVAVLVDAFMNTDFDSPAVRQALLVEPAAAAAAAAPGARGAKRGLEEDEEGGGGGGGAGPRDAYRMRVKARARAGGEG